jgi:hypothetical protein
MTVFEDNSLNEKTVAAVEKQIHYGDGSDPHKDIGAHHVEEQTPKSIV